MLYKKLHQKHLILASLILSIFFCQSTLAQIKRIGVDKDSEKSSQIPRAGESSQIPRASGEGSLRFNASTRIERVGLQQTGEATVKISTFTLSKPAPGPESLVVKANQLTKTGKFQQAIDLYNKIIQMRPQLTSARLGLGYTFIQMGDYDNAISEYQKIIDIVSDNKDVYLNLGVAFYGKQAVAQAIVSFEKALSTSSGKFSIAHFNLAMAESHQGNYEKAIKHYLQAIEQDKGLSEAYNNLGLVYEVLGDVDKALQCFQSAIEQEKGKYPLAHYNLGRFYYNQGQRDKAIGQFQLAIKYNPNFFEAYLDLANLYLFRSITEKTNEYEYAITNYEKAIALKKGFYPLAFDNLAVTLVKQGKLPEALANFRIAFEQYQGKCPSTLSNLLVTLTGEAIYSINNELSLIDNINNINYQKSSITIDERILVELEKYKELDDEIKNQVDVRYCAGQAYLALGKWQEAILEFSKAVELSNGKDKQSQEALVIANKQLKQ